jgi:septal ring factor EnvC (AmiA/AmiB activator)
MSTRQNKVTAAILTASLLAGMSNVVWAADKKSTKNAEQAAAEQQAAGQGHEEKIAQMQKSIDELKAEIAKIKGERTELQAKLEQSDKDVATQMQRIDEIKKSLAAKEQSAGVVEAEKKP